MGSAASDRSLGQRRQRPEAVVGDTGFVKAHELQRRHGCGEGEEVVIQLRTPQPQMRERGWLRPVPAEESQRAGPAGDAPGLVQAVPRGEHFGRGRSFGFDPLADDARSRLSRGDSRHQQAVAKCSHRGEQIGRLPERERRGEIGDAWQRVHQSAGCVGTSSGASGYLARGLEPPLCGAALARHFLGLRNHPRNWSLLSLTSCAFTN